MPSWGGSLVGALLTWGDGPGPRGRAGTRRRGDGALDSRAGSVAALGRDVALRRLRFKVLPDVYKTCL